MNKTYDANLVAIEYLKMFGLREFINLKLIKKLKPCKLNFADIKRKIVVNRGANKNKSE